MKIAYIYISIIPLTGVDKKPIGQAKALQDLGETGTDIFVLNPNKTEIKNGVHYVRYQNCKRFPYWDYLFKHNFNRYSVLKHIPLAEYDYIILRYPKADASGIRFFKNHNIITEHHSDEYTELKLEAVHAKSLPYKLLKKLRAFLEKKYGTKLLAHAKGIITVGREIQQLQQKRLPDNMPSKVISNGINLSSSQLTGFVPFDGKELNLIFPAGHDLFFHGLDRLIRGAENYAGSVNIRIHLLGKFDKSPIIKSPFVHYHGIVSGQAYENLMAKMNLGVSTLGLYRRKAHNTSTLKTCDFIARGLPFIMAYKDTVFSQYPPELKFFDPFPNNDSPIDFNQVIAFAEFVSSETNRKKIPDYMRHYAKKHLDWKIKMQEYISFVKEIQNKE